MRKFLPYIVWIIYVLILFASYTQIDTLEKMDEMTTNGMRLAHVIAAVSPVFFRPIKENLLRNIVFYVFLGVVILFVFRFTIMPTGLINNSSQQMLRGGCIVVSSILPIIILHFVNKKLG